MDTLTLSGWTQSKNALRHALPGQYATFDYSDYPSPEASFAGLVAYRDTAYVIGWSIGGQLALRAIAAGVIKPVHLTLIGTPFQFISSEHGTDAVTFKLFRENYRRDPLRSKTRFHWVVGSGDTGQQRIFNTLEDCSKEEDTARWLPWLDDLAGYSLAIADLTNVPATLIIHGENDAIVPRSQAHLLKRHIPHAKVSIWEETGHAPHLHAPARLMREIREHRVEAGV